VDAVLGLQFDLVLTGDERDTTQAFKLAFSRLLAAIDDPVAREDR